MSTSMTLSELMIATRQRADMLPTGYTPSTSATNYFVTDPELISYINQSYFELYDLLVQVYGDNYYVTDPVQFQTDGTSQLYPLPDGIRSFTNGITLNPFVPPPFFKLLGVDLSLSNTLDSFVTIRPFNFSDRNRYAVPNFQSFYGVTNLRYRIQGNQLWLTPIPSQGQTIQIWQIPRLTTLTNLGDTADGISGWTEYIICDGAIKCGQKEETDVGVLMAQKNALIQRIQSAAENRDAGSPPTVADHQYADMWWPDGSGGGGGGSGVY